MSPPGMCCIEFDTHLPSDNECGAGDLQGFLHSFYHGFSLKSPTIT